MIRSHTICCNLHYFFFVGVPVFNMGVVRPFFGRRIMYVAVFHPLPLGQPHSDLLHLYTPSRQLRSSAITRVFRVPSFRTKSRGQCSFSYQAPTTWNKLPASIRHASSVMSFKSSLKTFLFLKNFFNPLALRCLCVSRCVFVCECVIVCVQVCMHVFAVCVLELATSKYVYVLDL